MMQAARLVFAVPILMFALTAGAMDQESANSPVPDNPELSMPDLPLWEAGMLVAGVSTPAYPGSEDRVSRALPLPYVIYRGKYLRIDRETVGVRAIKTPRTELDIGFAASLGSRAADIEARRGMDDLGTLVEFGPRLKINIGDGDAGRRASRIQFAARGVFDVNDHLSYHGIAFEPQWVNEINVADSWSTSVNVGALLGDQQLADTFYRVSPAEATVTRPAYDARSGLISLRTSVFATRLIGQDVRIFGYVRYESLQGAANHDSPLVRSDTGWSVALGFAWTLAHSERSARD
jgi:outer membrane scaffolding protein for murein synthesis (MipA/OmpV family)